VQRALDDVGLAERAQEFAAWAGRHDGSRHAAELVEELAGEGA
jgi:UDP:flavonoid glycosyltransferase YjiC (YdhE family)